MGFADEAHFCFEAADFWSMKNIDIAGLHGYILRRFVQNIPALYTFRSNCQAKKTPAVSSDGVC